MTNHQKMIFRYQFLVNIIKPNIMNQSIKSKKNKWYKNPGYLAIPVAIVGIIVTIIIWRFPIKEPDFSISVNPILDTIQKPGKIQASVEIESINGYDFPVSLTSNNLPEDVLVGYNPNNGSTSQGYTSSMTISAGTEIREGQYTFLIIGNGGDGKEHTCKYNLTIVTPPQPPPTVSYTVYNDFGIASGDIQSWSGADWGNKSPKLIEGNYVVNDAPEGNKCFAITTGNGNSNYAGWGVFLGIFEKHKLVTPQTRAVQF